MYRFLLSWRWALTALIALLLIPLCIKLGFWQLHRHESRVARNTLIGNSLKAAPVPFDTISTGAGYTVPSALTWRTVTATGEYESAHEFVVRQRYDSGGSSPGFFVITPLKLADGHGEVLINRGWVALGTDATSYPSIPPAPPGRLTVTGRLRADETSAASGIRDRGGLPEHQYMLINTDQQTKATGATILGGYIELASTSPDPGQQAQLIPAPDHSDIGPHMAYTIQWWLFASMVPVGLWVLIRREAKDQAAAATTAAAGVPDPDPAPALTS
ncbi:SURF1 family cytochrome oxidase biogenesis protein [Kitasatospora kifunensis]|uniref:SURF1-like protein n=1 Tax=Kitasatospora kifunensis TaxID=58351 RepID=A0A7W7R5Y2_KITKI|nr:SURF1 family protein [Kitasatospora kifunensis]MBB4925998.1 cytochrome oxidase assembly protein ShyY1 [Kitasatospora kifunensis]